MFGKPPFKITYPYLTKHFQETQEVIEKPATRVFRIRLKSA